MSDQDKNSIVMVQGVCDYSVEVMPVESNRYGDLMCVCAEEGAIYINKEQAMNFWGIKDNTEQIEEGIGCIKNLISYIEEFGEDVALKVLLGELGEALLRLKGEYYE